MFETFQVLCNKLQPSFQIPAHGDRKSLQLLKTILSKPSPSLSNPLILWSPLDMSLVQEERLHPFIKFLGSSLDVTEN